MNNAWPPLPEVAARLGMRREGRNRWGPCPACGATGTRADGRPPVRFGRGWWCVSCGVKGDAINLVGLLAHGEARPRGRTFMACKNWLDASGEAVEQLAPWEPPRRIDPMTALRVAIPIDLVDDPRLDDWLARRKIPSWAPAGWLPQFSAPWWPRGWSDDWPIVIPACNGRGKIESMQGIATDDTAPRSKTWPAKAESRELLFANPGTRAWLAGKLPPPAKLLIVEGAPDYLTASSLMQDITVIGIAAGSAPALRLVTLTNSTEVYVGTHQDGSGRDYQRAVVAALEPKLVTPLPLWRLFA
mgnify:CR=1 FL=1